MRRVEDPALVRGEGSGKTRLALQIGAFNEAEYSGIHDLSVIVLFERTAR